MDGTRSRCLSAGLPAPARGNTSGSRRPTLPGLRRSGFEADHTPDQRGSSLAAVHVSVIVFRATVLSIALVFAAGPSASLLCKAWCDPHSAAISGCHHEGSGSSTSVTRDHTCRDSIQGSAAFLKEHLRGRASSGGTSSAGAVTQYQIAPVATSERLIDDHGRAPTGLKRPLNTPLRI